MTHLPWTDQRLRDAIAPARAQCRAGAGSVLDALLRMAGGDAAALAPALQRAGVAVLADGAARPDFARLDLATARAWRCAVARLPDGRAWLAVEDPWDEQVLTRASRHLGQALSPAAVARDTLQAWLAAGAAAAAGTPASAGAAAPAEGPIVAFVDAAIVGALRLGASDVHFECDRHGVTVKQRIDGVMVRFARLDGPQPAQETISRIKVLAQLDITERRLPQDGRFRFHGGGHDIDLRVSIMPSVFGEDAVLRLLDKAQLRSREEAVSLDALGFEPAHVALIRELAYEPSGMVLVTGPTGSGKTTTVYAALSEINTGVEKIITIEDPVEYELPGVLQIPVNERKGLTFAKGLRSILRHDPDRILVGEIRDAETAEIAVQSALTGHLVFTTVHANSMADIMGRFRHFGLDMFGFMSSLNGVVVQRLVRRLCPHCRGKRAVTEREGEWFAAHLGWVPPELPAPAGCVQCHGTGYHGRFVLAEVHTVDDSLRDLVTQGAPVSALKQHARDRGVQTLAAAAARRVLAGDTSIEEVKRVVGWMIERAAPAAAFTRTGGSGGHDPSDQGVRGDSEHDDSLSRSNRGSQHENSLSRISSGSQPEDSLSHGSGGSQHENPLSRISGRGQG
jgi:general secretion pathway protein E